MKKLTALALALMMAIGLVACGSPATTDEQTTGGFKIAVVTGTASQGEEEIQAAEMMKAKYPDIVVTATYPDNFTKETETTISTVANLCADPEVKALVFVQAIPGAAAAIAKVRETKPDILVIAGVPAEDPAVIAAQADIVYNGDEPGMGKTIAEQAAKMGAKTLIHYSFPRHMSYALISARHDLLKENCERLGIEFVDVTAPDPTGDSGVPGAQQFILEDVPKQVAKYGKDTAFFSTNCAMQEPLIKSVMEEGAIYPQQCCASPYHAYPGALGIEIPADKTGDLDYILSAIDEKVVAANMQGRMSTWPIALNMSQVIAGVEYAKRYLEGTITERASLEEMKKVFAEIGGEGVIMEKLTENGVTYDNFFMILSEYYTFGENNG